MSVLIVDDHPSFRANARALLEAEGFDVVGAFSYGVRHVRGIARAASRRDHESSVKAPPNSAAMRLDPNTHTFVLATAFLTSFFFAIFAMNVIALVLYYALN